MTFHGVEDFRERVSGRSVFLWGASIVGFGMCRALERIGLPPEGFLDKSERLQQTTTLGYPVLAPHAILASDRRFRSLIVVTSGHYESEIVMECRRAGLQHGVDFLTSSEMNAFDPSVDVSGACNLRCISCPRGNFSRQPTPGFMSAATYARVLDKLLREIPLLGNIQLYAWGEPLLNTELPAIIRQTTDRNVLCALSTNLNIRRDFRDVIRARPDWIKVSTSGFGAGYEITHTGGDWELLQTNLRSLQQWKNQYHPEMYVEVNYHLYRRNAGDEFHAMARFCKELGFAFRPNWAYLYPLDHIFAYCEGEELPAPAQRTLEMLLMPLDEGLDRARSQSHLECAEQRCLPIVWDLKVRSCGAYFEPTVADNFLETPLSEIVRRRQESGICGRCKAHALHRFTSVYLEESSAPADTLVED